MRINAGDIPLDLRFAVTFHLAGSEQTATGSGH